MKMNRTLYGTLALIVAVMTVGFEHKATASITMTYNETIVSARVGTNTVAAQTHSGLTIPTTAIIAVQDGDSASEAEINWTVNGDQTKLTFDFNHSRSGSDMSYGQLSSTFRFHASADGTYDLSGLYAVTNNHYGNVRLKAHIYDVTTDGIETLVRSSQDSSSAPDQLMLQLGGLEGRYPEYYGDLSGDLTAGHDYLVSLSAYIFYARLDTAEVATALGNITLTLTQNEVVPEPATLLIWSGLGLVAGCVGWRRGGAGLLASLRA